MAIISSQHNILFLHSPRTAGTSMSRYLTDHCGGVEIGKKHDTLEKLIGKGLLTQEQAHSLIKISCIRNPWDEFASKYQKVVSRAGRSCGDPNSWVWSSKYDLKEMKHYWMYQYDFDYYVEESIRPNGLFAWPNRRILKPTKNMRWAAQADVVLRYESLHEDIRRLFDELEFDMDKEFPRYNRTEEKKSYRQYYSDKSRAIIEKDFYMDTHLFGYTY